MELLTRRLATLKGLQVVACTHGSALLTFST